MFQRQLLKLLEQLSISSLDESESFSKIDQNNWHKQSISTEFFLKMFLNKLASSKMRKLKADKLTSWEAQKLTNWQAVYLTGLYQRPLNGYRTRQRPNPQP